MNVLLVTPRHFALWDDWVVPPIGIAYVSAYLKQQGCKVFTLNLLSKQGAQKDILRAFIHKYSIDAVGTGGLVSQFSQMKELMDDVKKIDPNILTFMGNTLVTYSPEEAMRGIENLDIGIIGEGEQTSYELISAIESGKDFAEVPGIIYRDGEMLRYTSVRTAIQDLDSLPFPDWDGFNWFEEGVYQPCLSTEKRIVSAPLVTSRGCPFSCTYCSKSGGGIPLAFVGQYF